jgi:imidazole glycerol-phosphate synthase subunit HisH
MPEASVVMIDYGVGNLLSVRRAFERIGVTVMTSARAEEIHAADRVILPGVGAFSKAMGALDALELNAVVRSFAASGKPLLGICLGMQLLLDESEEFGFTAGLGLIPGRVAAIPTESTSGVPIKIPHIGWTALQPAGTQNSWAGSLLETTPEGQEAYFVHSFRALRVDPSHRVADGVYGGHAIPAVIRRDNVHGCQFHPEKSGQGGLQMLQQFMAL